MSTLTTPAITWESSGPHISDVEAIIGDIRLYVSGTSRHGVYWSVSIDDYEGCWEKISCAHYEEGVSEATTIEEGKERAVKAYEQYLLTGKGNME